jgi:hypothetical protein
MGAIFSFLALKCVRFFTFLEQALTMYTSCTVYLISQ